MKKRTYGLALVGGTALAAGFLYACSGDDSSQPPPPPVNDAGADTSAPPATDAGGGEDTSTPTPTPEAGKPDGGAAPLCSSLPGTVLYIESGDTQEPLLKALGRQLRDDANITIVYQLTGSCTLTPNLYNGVAIPKNTNMLYIPSTAENGSWKTTDPELTCTTDPANGTPPNLGISALFPSSCPGLAAPPAGVGTFTGPIQAYTFIVPTTEFQNGQTAIWAEEAYYAFGDGAGNPVTLSGNPEWNDPSAFFLRPATKSTLVASAKNVGLTAAQMAATLADGGTDGRQLLPASSQVLAGVKASTNANAIGILGDEVYDANRGAGVNVLAFRAFGQSHAYYPDSTTTSFDKQNIRDGHYTLWSPTVYIAPVDGTGAITNPAVKYVTDLVLGNPTTPADGGSAIDGLGTVVSVGLTPNCAMQVQRSGDGAPLSSYTPGSPCTCYFLSKVPNAQPLPASCVACSASAPCAAGTCSNGYCETPPAPPADAGTSCDVSDGGYQSIINACTNAASVDKTGVNIPLLADGGLEPLQ
jgi:hypothetical protein